jgi:hypothetical protein
VYGGVGECKGQGGGGGQGVRGDGVGSYLCGGTHVMTTADLGGAENKQAKVNR